MVGGSHFTARAPPARAASSAATASSRYGWIEAIHSKRSGRERADRARAVEIGIDPDAGLAATIAEQVSVAIPYAIGAHARPGLLHPRIAQDRGLRFGAALAEKPLLHRELAASEERGSAQAC